MHKNFLSESVYYIYNKSIFSKPDRKKPYFKFQFRIITAVGNTHQVSVTCFFVKTRKYITTLLKMKHKFYKMGDFLTG
jgi:hypothetical protein